ncbi:hypothetical protein VRRI112168_02470 [Vreelandella rituensis]|uniref:Uncharacterized protein n=1 Tax=Vreelandella rituensis TaxID=2282306 RepID=A0A368U8U1_9GAMM|nr:hypothetical protein [Halomonas rituensis]RCV93608.1 hypothetical protein DU506_00190 [Halomonas rituensis]
MFRYLSRPPVVASLVLALGSLTGCAGSPDAALSQPGLTAATPLKALTDKEQFAGQAVSQLADASGKVDETGGWERQTGTLYRSEIDRFEGGFAQAPGLGFSGVISRQYTLGDRDTLADARRHLQEEILQEGIRQAGAYVSRQEVLDHTGMLEETLTVLTAANLERETLNEEVTTSVGGRPVLTLRVRVSTDGEALAARVASLHQDRRAQEALVRVGMENDRLRRQLQHRTLADLKQTPNGKLNADLPVVESPVLPKVSSGQGQAELPVAGRPPGGFSKTLVPSQAFIPEHSGMRLLPESQQPLYQLGVVEDFNEWWRRQRVNSEMADKLLSSFKRQLDFEIDKATNPGERHASYRVRVQGLDINRLQGLVSQAWGFPFAGKRWVAQDDIERMTPAEEVNFWTAWWAYASTPLGLDVTLDSRRKGGVSGFNETVGHYLVAPVRLAQGADGNPVIAAIIEMDDLAPDNIRKSGRLPEGVALAVIDFAVNERVTMSSQGDLHITFRSRDARVVPARIVPRLTTRNPRGSRNVRLL